MLPPRRQKSSVVSGKCGTNSAHDNNLEDHVKRFQFFLRMGLWTGLDLWKTIMTIALETKNVVKIYQVDEFHE